MLSEATNPFSFTPTLTKYAKNRQIKARIYSIQNFSPRRHTRAQAFLAHPNVQTEPVLGLMSSSFGSIQEQSTIFLTIYCLVANIIYLLRRSCVRNMPKRKLLQIRMTRENGVTIPLYITNLIAWQLFVNFIFPMLEPTSRVFGYVSFYYFYPNANGLGIVFEPLSVQDQPMSKRAKHQIRLDWHRFSVNVGNVGRDGYRHPPSVERNLPHLDVPQLGWKHWPWRRKFKYRD